jgi:ankyrin repeat protein
MEEKRINKCLKSYLIAKKYYNLDIDKSFEYFKQCIRILNEIKDNKITINDDLALIINETETECSKYLTNTIKTTIEKPLIVNINKVQNNNELFEIIEMGNIDKIKNFNYGELNFNIFNNQGFTPLHYAIIFGDTSFIKYALKLGACIDQTNLFGHTLLEVACLEKDPNIINFLLYYGANMKKHLTFRKNKKYFNSGYEMDIILLEIFVLESSNIENNQIKYLDWIFQYIKPNETINIELSKKDDSTISESKINFKTFVEKLDNLLCCLNKNYRDTYLNIIKEELKYDLIFKLGCPNKKIDIILYNLVPFIEYDCGQIQLSWLLSLEIKFLILKIFKNKTKINIKELKDELNNILIKDYIKPEIVPGGLIQVIMSQWVCKLKV